MLGENELIYLSCLLSKVSNESDIELSMNILYAAAILVKVLMLYNQLLLESFEFI